MSAKVNKDLTKEENQKLLKTNYLETLRENYDKYNIEGEKKENLSKALSETIENILIENIEFNRAINKIAGELAKKENITKLNELSTTEFNDFLEKEENQKIVKDLINDKYKDKKQTVLADQNRPSQSAVQAKVTKGANDSKELNDENHESDSDSSKKANPEVVKKVDKPQANKQQNDSVQDTHQAGHTDKETDAQINTEVQKQTSGSNTPGLKEESKETNQVHSNKPSAPTQKLELETDKIAKNQQPSDNPEEFQAPSQNLEADEQINQDMNDESDESELSLEVKKKRNAEEVEKLTNKLSELEEFEANPSSLRHAKNSKEKLEKEENIAMGTLKKNFLEKYLEFVKPSESSKNESNSQNDLFESMKNFITITEKEIQSNIEHKKILETELETFKDQRSKEEKELKEIIQNKEKYIKNSIKAKYDKTQKKIVFSLPEEYQNTVKNFLKEEKSKSEKSENFTSQINDRIELIVEKNQTINELKNELVQSIIREKEKEKKESPAENKVKIQTELNELEGIFKILEDYQSKDKEYEEIKNGYENNKHMHNLLKESVRSKLFYAQAKVVDLDKGIQEKMVTSIDEIEGEQQDAPQINSQPNQDPENKGETTTHVINDEGVIETAQAGRITEGDDTNMIQFANDNGNDEEGADEGPEDEVRETQVLDKQGNVIENGGNGARRGSKDVNNLQATGSAKKKSQTESKKTKGGKDAARLSTEGGGNTGVNTANGKAAQKKKNGEGEKIKENSGQTDDPANPIDAKIQKQTEQADGDKPAQVSSGDQTQTSSSVAAKPEEKGKGGVNWGMVGAIAGIIVIVAGGVYFFVLREEAADK